MEEAVGEAGFDTDVLHDQLKKLRILGFQEDRKGENIVSVIDGTIVFVDRKYSGENVAVGDIWLCSVTRYDTVYYAMPLRRITSSMIMGLSDEIREGIVNSLWASNKRDFEKIFEQRYREETYRQAYEKAREENEGIIAGLNARVLELTEQVEHSRMVIEAHAESEEDFIVLGSEEPEDVTSGDVPASSVAAQTHIQQEDDFNPVVGRRTMLSAPGMPEVRVQDQPQRQALSQRYVVERVTEETIQSDAFIDGKYFVHISPSRRFIVVRKHDYGQAICVNGRIRLEGLGNYSGFTGRCHLRAEYSSRFDGLMVYL